MQDNKKAYSRERHRLAIAGLFLSPVILIVFIAIGLPVYIKDISILGSPNEYIHLIVFYVIISCINYIITLPLIYYSEFVLEHKFSLSNQKLKDWIKREAKKGSLSLAISLPLVLSLYLFIKYWPLHWWILMAILWFFVSIFIAKFAPVLILPLFYKYSPIKNVTLKDRLIKLASRVGFKTIGVYEINMSRDTKKANAAVIGLGSQKRIILCDTLIENFNQDEICTVMGHELGHHKMRHMLKLIVLSGVFTIIVFFIANIVFLKLHSLLGYRLLHDFESLVLIYAIISVLGVFVSPLHNAVSRKLEKDADLFALNLTGDKNVFISTMKKLAEQNLIDPSPNKFYEIMLYNHPPISRRISFAESFKRET